MPETLALASMARTAALSWSRFEAFFRVPQARQQARDRNLIRFRYGFLQLSQPRPHVIGCRQPCRVLTTRLIAGVDVGLMGAFARKQGLCELLMASVTQRSHASPRPRRKMEGGGHDSHDADADYQDQEGVEPGHGVRPWAQAFARTTAQAQGL